MRSFLTRHAEFLGNVAIMMSGKTLAGLIALLTMPIVARLFLPDDFGVAAVFASIAGVVASLATLRYGMAIVLPNDESEAIDIMAFSFRVLFAVCVFVLLLLIAYSLIGASWAVLELLGEWMWFLPLGILLLSSVHINDAWLSRSKSFKRLSASIVAGNSATGVTRIGLGAVFGSSIPGLITGYLFGLLVRLRVQQGLTTAALRQAITEFDWPVIRAIAKKYSDFPKLNAPAALVFAIGENLPVLLFGVMFSPAVAGIYAMADRIAKVPVTIVATSIRRVFMQKAAGIRQKDRSLRKAFLLTGGGLALLGAGPFGMLWMFGQEISIFVLGERWSDAGVFLEIMSPWLFMMWVEAPCNSVFVVLRQQRLWLALQVTLTFLQSSAFATAWLRDATPEWTLRTFILVTVMMNLVTILTTLFLIIRREWNPRQGKSEESME